MINQKLSYICRFDGERWRDVKGKERKLLTDILDELGIIVDDNCEYARIKDYEKGLYIIFRAHGGIIDINVWDLETR